MYSWASTAIDQNARLGLGAPTRFCTSRPLTTTDLSVGRSLPRRRDDQPRHREAEGEGGPVRREDAPGPPLREPRDAVEPPAVAGRRQGQREAGQHDEHDDREPPVDEPAGPERRPVHRVAGERAQEDVVHHHEQRGQAADAVQAGQPLRRRICDRGTGVARACSSARHDRLPRRREPNAPRKRSRNALIGQIGAVRAGAHAVHPAPSRRSRRITAGSWAMTEIGTSWLAP